MTGVRPGPLLGLRSYVAHRKMIYAQKTSRVLRKFYRHAVLTSSVPKSVYDDIAEIACGFACESRSSSDKNISFSIREASTDEIFGSIEFESKTSNEEKKEDTWFNVCVNKSGFSIHNAEKNSEDSKSSLRNALLSSSLVAISEDSKNAIQKPNAPLVKNLSTLLSVLGILDRV